MKIVFNASIADLLHAGHLNLYRKMREQGDKVIVILHDDFSCYQIKDKFPVQTLEHRKRNLKMTGLADEIMVCKSTDPHKEFLKIIKKYKGQDLLYMRGDDLKKKFPGQWLLEENKIKIKFIPYTKGISSSKLRDEL
jgi:cytidyltransferase-like protein